MTQEKLFEIATKNKYRFPYKGNISVEDLWDLTMKELNEIYKSLSVKNKKQGEDSLLDTDVTVDQDLENQMQIVKYIFTQKKDEKERKVKEKEIKEKKQLIADILANKKNEELRNMSVEELEKMLSNIE